MAQELARASRELARLRSQIRGLDDPERRLASILLTSAAIGFLAVLLFAAWLLVVSP